MLERSPQWQSSGRRTQGTHSVIAWPLFYALSPRRIYQMRQAHYLDSEPLQQRLNRCKGVRKGGVVIVAQNPAESRDELEGRLVLGLVAVLAHQIVRPLDLVESAPQLRLVDNRAP